MIWAKTEAGRVEMQAKALIKERAQRNLLLLIDGHKSDEMLLANVVGIKADDFTALEAMGLIEPVALSGKSIAARPAGGVLTAPVAPSVDISVGEPEPIDYAKFTQTLTQLISKELGLRGFTLTLAVEKAGTIQELMDVASRTLDQIRDRKGSPAADAARRSLYGG